MDKQNEDTKIDNLYTEIDVENQIDFDLSKVKLVDKANGSNIKAGDKLIRINKINGMRELVQVTTRFDAVFFFKDALGSMGDEFANMDDLYHFDPKTLEKN